MRETRATPPSFSPFPAPLHLISVLGIARCPTRTHAVQCRQAGRQRRQFHFSRVQCGETAALSIYLPPQYVDFTGSIGW